MIHPLHTLACTIRRRRNHRRTTRFAKGGTVPAYSPSEDKIPAILSPGYFIPIRPGETDLEAIERLAHEHDDTGERDR